MDGAKEGVIMVVILDNKARIDQLQISNMQNEAMIKLVVGVEEEKLDRVHHHTTRMMIVHQ